MPALDEQLRNDAKRLKKLGIKPMADRVNLSAHLLRRLTFLLRAYREERKKMKRQRAGGGDA